MSARQIQLETHKRNCYTRDYINKAARWVIDFCQKNGIDVTQLFAPRIMPWNPIAPTDFSQFRAVDFLRFLEWWEMQQGSLLAVELAGAFIQGVAQPYLEPLGQILPQWLQTMLRLRLIAQWSYQVGLPVSARVRSGLEALIPDIDYPEAYHVMPQEVAEVPPAVRQAFLDGAKFSMSWIDKLSDDARSQMRDLLAINTLKGRSPDVAVPILERILRRDRVAKELGITAGEVTPEQIQQWADKAKFEVVEAMAKRAELISRTESMRMINLGILNSLEAQGGKLAYIMPHRGTCPDCQRLLDGRVFRTAILKENLFKNFGYTRDKWVASVPQHPRCRHSVMPPPYSFKDALKGRSIPREGLLLEWYGLPGGREAMEELSLERKPWLKADGAIG